MSERPKNPRCASACRYCRVKKIKCDGRIPCVSVLTRDEDHGEDCVHPNPSQVARKRKEKADALEERFARLEALLHVAKIPRLSEGVLSNTNTTDDGPLTDCRATPAIEKDTAPSVLFPFTPISVAAQPNGLNGGSIPSHPSQTNAIDEDTRSFSNGSSQPQHHGRRNSRTSVSLSPLDIIASSSGAQLTSISPPNTRELERPVSGLEADTANDIEGNASYLAICAEPATDWMSRRIGMPDFTEVARELTLEIWGSHRLEAVQPERAPEPDFATAWSWTQSHFDEAMDGIFGGIDRQAFEQRLMAQFESHNVDADDDRAWYALRNTVYASGCRVKMAKASFSGAFTRGRQQAYRFFENALSVHTELIYARSSIGAVQALMIMAYFSEGTGDLALEHMLVSNAVRLAQFKGLHRRTKASATLTEEEVSMRQLTWWNLYIHDKHLALRSGRPSAINDSDITCPVPNGETLASQTNAEFYHLMVKHSQITSLVLKRLSGKKIRTKSGDHILRTAQDLDKQLRDWHASLPSYYKNGPAVIATELPKGLSQFQVGFVSLIYNSCLIVIHNMFCYPWIRLGVENEPHPAVLAQRQQSLEIVAGAAREIIVVVQNIGKTVGAGLSTVTYFPMVGLYNLFLHVLQQPALPTTRSDLALMDTVVGHYGYLEYISESEFSTRFPHKVVLYAREIIKRSREPSPAHDVRQNVFSTDLSGFDIDPGLHDFIFEDWNNLGLDNWSFPRSE